MTEVPFTVERDPHNGRPYRAVGGEPQTGYVSDEEALLFAAVSERDGEIRRLRDVARAGCERVSELEAENASLRADLDAAVRLATEQEAENARLRSELLRGDDGDGDGPEQGGGE